MPTVRRCRQGHVPRKSPVLIDLWSRTVTGAASPQRLASDGASAVAPGQAMRRFRRMAEARIY